MSKSLLAGLVAVSLLAAPAAFAQDAAPATAAAAKVSTKSPLKDLLANQKAIAVVGKYAPQVAEFFASGQAESVVPMTASLADIAAQFPQAADAGLTPENLKKMDEDLAKL